MNVRPADRFEAETTELPALSDEDVEQARKRRKVTPAGFIPAVNRTGCTDPAYVAYLERELASAHASAESARAVFHVVGAHNAALTNQVESLALQLAESEAHRSELMERLLAMQAALDAR